MAKWLLIKDGVVKHALVPRGDKWMNHYRASKFIVIEVEDTEPATEGWLYQDGAFVNPNPSEPSPEP